MKLKSIEICGFKSFAEKITLKFAPGITAIVGPNGCGKSNIADAVRWVLGEQSVKSLRGSKMPDVIFSGSALRASMPYAKVSITFTDASSLLALPYEEVTITRQLQRSGQSDYFLNGQHVRLKDIRSLLLGTTISVLEQGKMDQMIHNSPMERRQIFEDVAGISRLMVKREEARQKLEKLQQNLDRIVDLAREIERQMAITAKQAAVAKAYLVNKERLEQLEKGRLITKWGQVKRDLEQSNSKRNGVSEQGTQQKEQVFEQQKVVQQVKEQLSEREKQQQQCQEKLYSASTARQLCQQRLHNAQEKLAEMATMQAKWQKELVQWHSHQQEAQQQQTQQQQLFLQLQVQSSALQQEFNAKKEALEQINAEWEEFSHLYQQRQNELIKQTQAEKTHDGSIKQLSTRIELGQEKVVELQQRQAKLCQLQGEQSQDIAQKRQSVELLAGSIDKKRGQIERFEELLKEKDGQIKQQAKVIEQNRQLYLAKQARWQALIQLRNEGAGASQGYQAILRATSNASSPFFGKVIPLAQRISLPETMQQQLALLWRHYAHTFVVDTQATCLLLLQWAKQQNIRDFSVVCESLFLPSPSQNDTALPPSSSLPCEPIVAAEAASAQSPLFAHFVQQCWHASDIEAAWHSAELLKADFEQIYAGEGLIIDRRGVLFCCSLKENSSFLREAELKTLEAEQKELERSIAQKQASQAQLVEERAAYDAEKRACDQAMRSEEMKLVEYNFALQRAVQDSEKMHKQIDEIASHYEQAVKTIAEYQTTLAQEQKSHEAVQKALASSRHNLEYLQAELSEREQKCKSAKEQLRLSEESFRQAQNKTQQTEQALKMATLKQEQAIDRQEHMHQQLQESGQSNLSLAEKQKEEQQLLHQLQVAEEEAEGQKRQNAVQLAACKKELEAAEELLGQKRRRLKQLEQEQQQFAIHIAQHMAAQTALEEEMLAHFGAAIDPEGSSALALDMPLTVAEKEIGELRQKMQAAGNVNLAAIEECQEQNERHSHVQMQLTDLQTGKTQLEQIITELEEQGRNLFGTTFAQVRSYFQKNFQILFNGGEADLTLVEGQDLLQCGIEISAKPPGKQMRTIQLLSGGEKCLTAMALLFAIFEVKPAPFCILDEIDAPLDDANVERFGNVVKQFIDRSQFIIITHNKRTMAIADMLFGVSMEEKGVSKVLCMEFAKDPGQYATLV